MPRRDCHGRVGFHICRCFRLLPVEGRLSGCGGRDLKFPTAYQTTYPNNAQVLFGKLDDAESAVLMLPEVFCVQRTVFAENQEVKNLRGQRRGYTVM